MIERLNCTELNWTDNIKNESLSYNWKNNFPGCLINFGILISSEIINITLDPKMGFPCGSAGRDWATELTDWRKSRKKTFGWEKKWDAHMAMAPHSSTLAWKIPWTGKPGRLQSLGSLRSDSTEQIHFQFSLSCLGEGNGNPLQCSCLEDPRDWGAWWAAIYGVAWSQTRLKWLRSI